MKISIITPVFNNEKTIEKTILSVLRQKTVNVEYIIIDGKSTDRTMDVVEKYRNKIDIIVSEKDKGISDAYNKGIQKATGDLIGIVAADDQLIYGAIDAIRQQYNGADVLAGNMIVHDSWRYKQCKSNHNLGLLRLMTSICHPATFIRKSAYSKFGTYSLEYRCAIDRELLLRFYKNGATFQFVNDNLSFMAGGGISTDNPCRYAFPEDRIISIKYGLNATHATLFYYKSILKYYLGKYIKIFADFTRLSNVIKLYMQKKGSFLTEIQINDLNTKVIL